MPSPETIRAADGSLLRTRLFVMMALQIAIWGAWAPKLFPYMTMPGFTAPQQAIVGSSWGIAAVIGIFFSNQFADRNFAAQRFLAASHLLSGLCLLGAAWSTGLARHAAGTPAGVRMIVDYRTLFLIPMGLALVGALLLAFAFRPPTRGPAAVAEEDAPHLAMAPGAPLP